VKRGTVNKETKPALLNNEKELARSHQSLVLNMSVLVTIALWAAVTFAQQPTGGGANLFAPSVQAGKEIDAERALPTTLLPTSNIRNDSQARHAGSIGTGNRLRPTAGDQGYTHSVLHPNCQQYRHTRVRRCPSFIWSAAEGRLAVARVVAWHQWSREPLCSVPHEIFVLQLGGPLRIRHARLCRGRDRLPDWAPRVGTPTSTC
jgi:hypothetical protein